MVGDRFIRGLRASAVLVSVRRRIDQYPDVFICQYPHGRETAVRERRLQAVPEQDTDAVSCKKAIVDKEIRV